LRPLGEVFPTHLVSGGKLLLAALPPEQFEALYRVERWQDRLDERPDPDALAVVRKRGFAINKDRTEPGVYAVGRALRIGDCPAAAALAPAMPTVRVQRRAAARPGGTAGQHGPGHRTGQPKHVDQLLGQGRVAH
jgi:DNA-binding IclR family transcriptional regulator